MKSVFQLGKSRTDWLAETVSNPAFKEAVCFAIAEYSTEMTGHPGDGFKMAGAQRILQILQNLSDPKKTTAPKRETLDYSDPRINP